MSCLDASVISGDYSESLESALWIDGIASQAYPHCSTLEMKDQEVESIFGTDSFIEVCTSLQDYWEFDKRIVQYISLEFIGFLKERILEEDFAACHFIAATCQVEPDFAAQFLDIFSQINAKFSIYIIGHISSIPISLIYYVICFAFPSERLLDITEEDSITSIHILIKENRNLFSETSILKIIADRALFAFGEVEEGLHSDKYVSALVLLISKLLVPIDRCFEYHLENVFRLNCPEETTEAILEVCVRQHFSRLAVEIMRSCDATECSHRLRVAMARAAAALINIAESPELAPLVAPLALAALRSCPAMRAYCLNILLALREMGASPSACGIDSADIAEVCEEVLEDCDEEVQSAAELLLGWGS